jgi:NAD(P) transhydrogenase subunit alpha
VPEETSEAKAAREQREVQRLANRITSMVAIGGALLLLIGTVAPESFMQHFIVFVLSCFLGALLQIGSSSGIVTVLAAISVLIASINIFGGFLVTRRMLAMFQKS